MIRRLAIVALCVTAQVVGGSKTSSAQPLRVLYVYPPVIRPTDDMYLSGEGFPPHQSLTLVIACPTYQDPLDGAVQIVQSPITDRNGDFSGFRFNYSPAQSPAGPIPCSVYVRTSNNPTGGVDIPGRYTVFPSTAKLPHCDTTMCVTATYKPLKVHLGKAVSIIIRGGWGGALADFTVSYPAVRPQIQHHVLNPRGSTRAIFTVPQSLAISDHLTAHVSIKVHLGSAKGSSNGYFTVIR